MKFFDNRQGIYRNIYIVKNIKIIVVIIFIGILNEKEKQEYLDMASKRQNY